MFLSMPRLKRRKQKTTALTSFCAQLQEHRPAREPDIAISGQSALVSVARGAYQRTRNIWGGWQ